MKHPELIEYYKNYQGVNKTSYPKFYGRVVQNFEAKETAIKAYFRLKKPRQIKTKVDPDGRVCTKCLEYKVWSEYCKSAVGVMGYNNTCRECCKKVKLEYRLMTGRAKDKEYKKKTRTMELGTKLILYEPIMINGVPTKLVWVAIKYEYRKGYLLYNKEHELYKNISLGDNQGIKNNSCRKFYKVE